MNVAAKPEPGIETNGELKPVARAFASIVFPVPGAPRKRRPRSRLPPARSNASPDCQIETTRLHLLLRLRLPTDVRKFDSPLGVSRLEGLDLREVHDQQRAEEDREVHDHVEGEDQEERQDSHEVAGSSEQVEEEADDDRDDRDLQPEAPEPDATARDDVLLAQLLALEPEQARPRDEAVEDEVERAAEADDDEQRGEDRPVPRPALRLVEPNDERRGREERDGRRGASQPAPLTGELRRELGLLQTPQRLGFGRHVRSVGTPVQPGCLRGC